VSATTGLLDAILAVQAEAPTLTKNATNPHFKSKYAPLDTIVETIGPILAKHKLVWTAKPSWSENLGPTLKYRIAHAPSGESDEGEMPLLLSKNDAQGQGSAITYARRYALCAYLNLVADDDDDGARASARRQDTGPELASAAQRKYLKTLITQQRLDAAAMDFLFAKVGFQRQDGEKVNDAVHRLSKPQCSELIETLKDGAVPTGGTDVPADADEFVHPPVEPDDVLGPS
jgi:hypothetical protein